MYKPDEVALGIGYHPRTVRRLIHIGRINAVNSNLGGKQPVWWISQEEFLRLKNVLTGVKKLGRPTAKIKQKIKMKK